ncbi:MAG TPA: hypothetical protein VHB02_01420 [Acidimicrobiales bacterium]|nr:hypothetical protein [Acidimicrobiales bacterium]
MRPAGRRPAGHLATVLVAATVGAAALLAPVVAPTAAGAATRRGPTAPPSTDWGASVAGASDCDPLGGSTCMVPFPSDYYTVVDRSMPSGRQVAFPKAAMPTNVVGLHITPAAYGRNDGFSPGSTVLVHVAGIDLARSGIPDAGHVGTSLRRRAGVVLVDEATGKRLAYWAELDARDGDPATRLLMVHPAANLPEGHRIAVALTGVRTAKGAPVAPGPAFAAVLGRRPAPQGVTAAFLDHERALVSWLHRRHVPTGSLTVAWDFTVISTRNLTGYAVHMRDVAMAQLHGGAPSFAVTAVTDFTTAQDGSDSRQVDGTFTVPSFLDQPGGPYGSTLNLGPTGLPQQLPGNVQQAAFSCLVPRSATAAHPARPVLYGVGLFNVAAKIGDENVSVMADRYDMVLCATDWMGLTGNDELADAALLADLSNFTTLPDHLTQSLIDALYLGRLMTAVGGLASDPAFRTTGAALVDTSSPLTYYGNSEGSLAGGALTAISTVFRRAVLGVPSMDYAVLLDRSSDFVAFNDLFQPAYPGPANRQVIFDLLQMQWDRGETDGYAEQMTGGLPGTPRHQVLLQMGFGDHQVSNVTTVAEARTIGAAVHLPALAPGRFPGHLFWGLRPIRKDPYRGRAALYVWDPGVPAPPATDEPPTAGTDPHQTVPREVPAAQYQLNRFQLTGTVPNVCGRRPCTTPVTGGDLTG